MSRCQLRQVGVLALTALVLVGTGCQYRWGTVMHPQLSSLAVGAFDNDTRESVATAQLRGALSEFISTEPGVALKQPEQADAIIEGRIVNLRQRRLARAEVRQEDLAEDDADEYQTVLYRVEAVVEYRVRLPGSEKVVLEQRRVVGEADMGRWPDQQVMRARAIEKALADAARQIVSALTEAW